MRKLIRAVAAGLLVVALSVTLSQRVEAQSSQSGNLDFSGIKTGIIVAAVAVGIGVVVAVVLLHKSSQKRTITGCAVSGASGTSLTDDKDKHLYALTGDMSEVKTGERMTLQVKKVKLKDAGKSVAWEPRKVVNDLGVCAP